MRTAGGSVCSTPGLTNGVNGCIIVTIACSLMSHMTIIIRWNKKFGSPEMIPVGR